MSEARKKHMASGGCMGFGCKHPSHYEEGGEVEKEASHQEHMKRKESERHEMHGKFMKEHERLMALPMPKMAEGGEMEMDDDIPMDMHEDEGELMDILADELMRAIEHKDKKEILESIKAIVLSCKE